MKTYRIVFHDDNGFTFITVPWAKTRIGAWFVNNYAFIKYKKIKRKTADMRGEE